MYASSRFVLLGFNLLTTTALSTACSSNGSSNGPAGSYGGAPQGGTAASGGGLQASGGAFLSDTGGVDDTAGGGIPNGFGGTPLGAGGVASAGGTSSTKATGGSSGESSARGGRTSSADGGSPASAIRDVLLVGNSAAGTVSVIDGNSYEILGSVNIIPDIGEVMMLINSNPIRAAAYPVVKSGQVITHFEPSGGDRFVDDVFVSPDGTMLYVSRSNLGDVAAFDLTKADHPRLWQTFVDGVKADHATISPDGTKLIVSATTATVADLIDTATGKITGSFPTGTYPHQNDYSADGKFIYNSSIGTVGTPYANNATKGNRWLIQVDANTLQVVKTWVFDYGVRPNVVSADQSTLYTDLSYLNGLVKYDLTQSKEVARSDQPLSAFATKTYASYDEYPHDSAHHGLALSGDGKSLCDCGTVDDTVSIVSTDTMTVQQIIDVGLVPYWATTSVDGKRCFVSISGDNTVSIIDYASAALVKTVPVGHFPQRNRLAKIPQRVIALLDPSNG